MKPFVPNLRVKEHELYKSVYCGLCRSMQKHTGNLSRVTLSYDMTFFALCRMALCETEFSIRKRRCAVHPMTKRAMMDDNHALSYAAYVSAVFSAYKLWDTVTDEKGLRRMGAKMLRPYASFLCKRARRAPYEILSLIKDGMARISALENEKCAVPDRVADAFGELLGSLLAMGLEGASALIAKEIGLHTGRFVYLIDAANDYDEDMKKGAYNPFFYAFSSAEQMESFRKNTLHGVLAREKDMILHALALLDFEGKAMLYSCMENIITDGLENALSMTVGKETTYGK